MEWIERLNETINYIEENLMDKIDYSKLGQIACCSSYHFQRMFTYISGMPLSEYIRKRKMSLAAVDLQGGKEKIIDVAAKYQLRLTELFIPFMVSIRPLSRTREYQ